MSNLAEWLIEQVDADEQVAKAAISGPDAPWYEGDAAERFAMTWTRERVLVECAAKRQIIDVAFEHEGTFDAEMACCHDGYAIRAGLCPATPVDEIVLLQMLALPYAGRDGYRPEWAPDHLDG